MSAPGFGARTEIFGRQLPVFRRWIGQLREWRYVLELLPSRSFALHLVRCSYSTRSRSDYCSSTRRTRIPVAAAAAAVLEERATTALRVGVSTVRTELTWFPACVCNSLDSGVKSSFHGAAAAFQFNLAPMREEVHPCIPRVSKQPHSAALQLVCLACFLTAELVGDENKFSFHEKGSLHETSFKNQSKPTRSYPRSARGQP